MSAAGESNAGPPRDWQDLAKEGVFALPLSLAFERYNEEQLALIDGDWKIVRRGPAILGPHPADAPPGSLPERQREPTPVRIELFNLATDPPERDDLSEEGLEKARKMLERLREFRALRSEEDVPPMTAPPSQGWAAPRGWRMLD